MHKLLRNAWKATSAFKMITRAQSDGRRWQGAAVAHCSAAYDAGVDANEFVRGGSGGFGRVEGVYI